jgi:LmbE family N-acetylglucosaminyl deacetylase
MAVTSAKRKQRQKRYVLVAAALLVLLTLLNGHWLLAALLLLLFYLTNELLLSDHVFYSPRSDYCYRLRGAQLQHHWRGAELGVPVETAVGDTLLLQLPVAATLAGRWFDPCMVVSDGGRSLRQYLERGVGGTRYLNLSSLAPRLAAGQSLHISGEYCRVDSGASVLWSWDNSALAGAPALVVAPHADDAEIAAFGFYSRASDCTLVTVTAGETEVEQFMAWTDDEQQASRFKGEVRCLDSAAAALWGGLQQEQCINLGYGCLQLQTMQQQPDQGVSSPYSGLADSRPYRRFNRLALPSDIDGTTSWNKLVADLVFILEAQQPQLIVCPHPLLDTHSDHRYTTLALWLASRALAQAPRWLLYANHLDASQDFPFGPADSERSLPPAVQREVSEDGLYEVPVDGLYSIALDADARRRKALALDLMHDLKRPQKWKKWWRKRLQRLLLRRPLNPYGEDDFFRKAVRQSELFIVADAQQMAAIIETFES